MDVSFILIFIMNFGVCFIFLMDFVSLMLLVWLEVCGFFWMHSSIIVFMWLYLSLEIARKSIDIIIIVCVCVTPLVPWARAHVRGDP